MPWKCPDCGTINWHGAGCRLCSAEPEPEPEPPEPSAGPATGWRGHDADWDWSWSTDDEHYVPPEPPPLPRPKLATEGQRIRGTDGNNAAVRFCRVKGNNK